MIRLFNPWEGSNRYVEQIIGDYGIGVYGTQVSPNSKVDHTLGIPVLSNPKANTSRQGFLDEKTAIPAINHLLFKVAYVFLHTTEQGD